MNDQRQVVFKTSKFMVLEPQSVTPLAHSIQPHQQTSRPLPTIKLVSNQARALLKTKFWEQPLRHRYNLLKEHVQVKKKKKQTLKQMFEQATGGQRINLPKMLSSADVHEQSSKRMTYRESALECRSIRSRLIQQRSKANTQKMKNSLIFKQQLDIDLHSQQLFNDGQQHGQKLTTNSLNRFIIKSDQCSSLHKQELPIIGLEEQDNVHSLNEPDQMKSQQPVRHQQDCFSSRTVQNVSISKPLVQDSPSPSYFQEGSSQKQLSKEQMVSQQQQSNIIQSCDTVSGSLDLQISSQIPDPNDPCFQGIKLSINLDVQEQQQIQSAKKEAAVQTIMPNELQKMDYKYFERAGILRYLHFNKDQYRLQDLFPNLSKEIGRVFYDGEFQPSNELFTEGQREKGMPSWLTAFSTNEVFINKNVDHKFQVQNKSNYMQNLTAVINFINLKDPEYIFRLFEEPNDNAAALLRSVWLFPHGEIKPHFIDDQVPYTFHGCPYFNYSLQGEAWVAVLEKAIAKQYGNYSKASRVQPSIILKTLTAAPTLKLGLEGDLYTRLKRHLDAGALVMAVRPENSHQTLPILISYEENVLEDVDGCSKPVVKKNYTKHRKNISVRCFMVENLGSPKELVKTICLCSGMGESFMMKLSDFMQFMCKVTATYLIKDYFYGHENIIMRPGQVYSFCIATKANHIFFTLIQKEEPVPARISLYRHSNERSHLQLIPIAHRIADSMEEFFLDIQVEEGHYSLFIQAVSTSLLQNLGFKGFNPIVGKYSRQNLCEFVVGFYSRERLKIYESEVLLNQGNCLSSKGHYLLGSPKSDIDSFFLSLDKVQEYIKMSQVKMQEEVSEEKQRKKKKSVKEVRKKRRMDTMKSPKEIYLGLEKQGVAPKVSRCYMMDDD